MNYGCRFGLEKRMNLSYDGLSFFLCRALLFLFFLLLFPFSKDLVTVDNTFKVFFKYSLENWIIILSAYIGFFVAKKSERKIMNEYAAEVK